MVKVEEVDWLQWVPPSKEDFDYFATQGSLKPHGEQHNIEFDFTLIDISSLDERSHCVVVNFWTEIRWTPAVPAFMSQKRRDGEPSRVEAIPMGQGLLNRLMSDYAADLWDSQLDVLGALSLAPEPSPHVYFIHVNWPDGARPCISLRQRWSGTVRHHSSTRWFPFDVQQVDLVFKSKHHGPGEFSFDFPDHKKASVEESARRALLGMKDWQFLGCRFDQANASERDSLLVLMPGSGDFEVLTISFVFRRRWLYWIMKYVLPMDIIVASGWSPFFLYPAETSDTLASLSIVVTVLLAFAAYTITLSNELPKTYFNTLLDRHASVCFIILFFTITATANTPPGMWAAFSTWQPYSPVAKLAILFGIWHVGVLVCLFIPSSVFTKRKEWISEHLPERPEWTRRTSSRTVSDEDEEKDVHDSAGLPQPSRVSTFASYSQGYAPRNVA